mgnify:CR=1 FL=1
MQDKDWVSATRIVLVQKHIRWLMYAGYKFSSYRVILTALFAKSVARIKNRAKFTLKWG